MPDNPLQLLRDYQNVLAKHVTQRPGLSSASPRYESPSCTERTTERTLRLSHRESVSHARDAASSAHSTPTRNAVEASRVLQMFSEERRSRQRFESPSASIGREERYTSSSVADRGFEQRGAVVRVEREISQFCGTLLCSMGVACPQYDRWQLQAERVIAEVSKLCNTIEQKTEEAEALRQSRAAASSPKASVDEMKKAREQIEELTAQLSVLRSMEPPSRQPKQPATDGDLALVEERESLQTKLLNVSRGLMRRGRWEHEQQEAELQEAEAARLRIVVEQVS